MQYASGKTKIARQVSETILNRLGGEYEIFRWQNENCESNSASNTHTHTHTHENSLTLVSLFCGGLSVETKLAPYFDRIICNDKQEYLIELYRSVQGGWKPPMELTEEQYKYIREHPQENKALTAFAGFGCSFGGKWFGGYGRHGTKDKHALERSMCEESRRALLRDINILNNAEFTCLDYRDVPLPPQCIIYADPPYKGKMAAYGLHEEFDSGEFWQWCRDHSKDHMIFISELEAPPDFAPIWERQVLRQMANCNADNFKSTEKLYIYV